MKRSFFIAIIATLCWSTNSIAQLEMSVFTATGRGGVATTFATDYQAIGINPANLGFKKSFKEPKFTVGFLESNVTFFSEALDRKETFDAIFKSSKNQFSFEDKWEAANKVAGTNLSLNVDAMLIGYSFRLPKKLGGGAFAFSVRDRMQLFARINRNASEIAFLGYASGYFPQLRLANGEIIQNPLYPGNEGLPPLTENQYNNIVDGFYENEDNAKTYGEILNGSRISSSWFREYNLSYGQQVLENYDVSIFVGAGVKLIRGLLLIDLEAENNSLPLSNIAVSPTFGLDFGDDAEISNPTFKGSDDATLLQTLVFPEKSGSGFGFDIGFTAVIKRNLYLGFSMTNIGKLTWDGNVYKVADGHLKEFSGQGLNNYNILSGEDEDFQFLGDKSPFEWEGSNEIKVELPSVLRFGASYEYFRTVHFGFDLIIPRNKVAGNLDNTLVAIGGDFRPSKTIKVSTGVNFGGNNDSKINFPIGITYLARRGFYEAGIATRDVTTYLANLKGGSTISFATGFLRLKL